MKSIINLGKIQRFEEKCEQIPMKIGHIISKINISSVLKVGKLHENNVFMVKLPDDH